jgi:hypothetical protein
MVINIYIEHYYIKKGRSVFFLMGIAHLSKILMEV